MLRPLALVLLMLAASPARADDPPTTGHITGVGGVFFKARDPAALTAWYHDVLGLPLTSWGGITFVPDAPGHPPVLVWTAFPANTHYFAPSKRDLMIDYAVDDLDAFLAGLTAKGVTVLKRDDSEPTIGRFAWILDLEGNKVELWQPAPQPAPTGP